MVQKNKQGEARAKKALKQTEKSEAPTKVADKKAQVKEKPRQRHEWLVRTGIVAAILVVFAIPLVGVGLRTARKTAEYQDYQVEQGELYEQAQQDFAELYEDVEKQVPKLDVTEEEIAELETELGKIKYKEYLEDRDDKLKKLEVLREFLSVRDEVLGRFDGEVMKSETTTEQIEELKMKVAELSEGQQSALVDKLAELVKQRQIIDEFREAVAGLYQDEDKTLAKDVSRTQLDDVLSKAAAVVQEDVRNAEQAYIDKVKAEVERKEEEARRIAEEARKKREAEIAAAWVKLNVPYISQNAQQIFNGCEAASLLMGLQYKGYLRGMTLGQYVEMMPKSTDPFQGFINSVYDLEPKTAPHWIAPAPLAKFGRESSGANIQDVTGYTLDQLDAEIAQGNPVIIYLTYLYREPKEVVEGAPLNLHVMLLTGYNKLTGMQMTTDPWTGAGGKRNYELTKSEVEAIYNRTGRRAVVIR